MAKVAITYSQALGTVRRLFFPDNDLELNEPVHGPWQGEAQIIVERTDYDREGAQALVNKETGHTPHRNADRFAIVHPQGHIVDVLIGDPACGLPIPNDHLAIQHAEASPGWHFIEGSWIAPPDNES